ncbi:polyamine aminopropyltransferase [Oceanobacillus chungangensis]|uniref:polyamine aminopropyltransferase n=1 Tax=Oceanobacillus chungangensis TaxID=1229152 RepID=UPI001FE57C61|nr:polyamine aminopropyltransferase [Oceanobacillus chungangensis]
MVEERELKHYKKIHDQLWISNYVVNARMKTEYKVKSLLHYEVSPIQEISVVETKGFGRLLVLDGVPQISTGEGFIYNEMISHIPIITHPNPKKVAAIGGGDSGQAREAMKYASIEEITVVELDPQVTSVCRTWLTPDSYYDKDSRFRVVHQDGIEWIKENREYDVLIIDRPDPVGQAKNLFKSEFYKDVYDGLTDDGIVVFQSGSPFYNTSTLRKTYRSLKELFPIVRTYLITIPLFPSGIWSLIIASKKYDPLDADLSRLQDEDTKYINKELFLSSFALPNYVKEILES